MKEKFKENIGFKEEEKEIIIENNHEEFLNNQNKKFKNKLLDAPLILYFFIIVLLFAIFLIIYYINFYNTEKENFKIFKINWILLPLNDREYENYLFSNTLEVMLIQDRNFDRDGGAIVIERGYLDNPYEEGLSTFATSLLSHIAFNNNPNNIDILEDYFGKFKYGTEEHYINFRFDILNDGLKKFFTRFSSIINIDSNKILTNFNESKIKVLNEIKSNYEENQKYIDYRENHLIEYLVYEFKNESGNEILPEGNFDKLRDVSFEEISNYIKSLINPSKIKIVLFSKYKFSILSKYMKYYFSYLTNAEILSNDLIQKYNKENINRNEIYNFNTSQIFYIKANNYESNYIKIIYYINKVANETYSELSYKQYYFNYISDFISKTKNCSLYSKINNNIISIKSNTEIVLKSKIKFSIIINLINLENINDVIYETYRYIHKITNETNQKKIQMDRYEELKEIYRNNMTLKEKTYNTIELAKANAEHLIESKYAQKYYFYFEGVPWNDDINNNNETIPNEAEPYFRQLTPNNSIIILAIRDKDRNQLNCNETSKFYLNCSYLKNESNLRNTFFYNVSYINQKFNSSNLTYYLNEEENDDFNISYEKNQFKSEYIKPLEGEEFEDEFKTLYNETTLNKFYFKNINIFGIPRVLIKFNLYHPFLRPNNTNKNDTKCYYFLILEMFSAIKRKINEQLSDAILAENKIYFGQNENNLYIIIYCFSDMAFNISKKVKNIIYDTNWENETDFKNNNEIYKNETFDDFLIYDKNEFQEIARFYFKSKLKNNIFNKYEFFPKKFESNYYNQCIQNLYQNINQTELTSFIVQGYIYGYCEKDVEQKIYELFISNNSNICQDLL